MVGYMKRNGWDSNYIVHVYTNCYSSLNIVQSKMSLTFLIKLDNEHLVIDNW